MHIADAFGTDDPQNINLPPTMQLYSRANVCIHNLHSHPSTGYDAHGGDFGVQFQRYDPVTAAIEAEREFSLNQSSFVDDNDEDGVGVLEDDVYSSAGMRLCKRV